MRFAATRAAGARYTGPVSYLQIVLLAVGLAMDATAVAAARGAASRTIEWRDVLLPAFLFGLAQAVMPTLGWVLGRELGAWVAAFDHWFAFVVMGGLGAKMLHESRELHPDERKVARGLGALLMLALATSVDAFAVGLTLPLLDAPFALSIATIGVVTGVLSALGVLLGRRMGRMLGPRLDMFGGAVLILLGCKILIEHLSA
jgi:manganese efflux pump family protein